MADNQDARADRAEGDTEGEVIEIELEPESGEDIIEVVLEPDTAEEAPTEASPEGSAVTGAGGGKRYLPADGLEAPPAEAATGDAAAEELEAACAYTRQPFVVMAIERGEGAYEVIGAQPLPPGTPVGQPAGKGRTVKGVFYLSRYSGCPHCGAGGLILCQTCGVISCGATDKKTGEFLPCPVCGSGGPVQKSKTGWSVQVLGKGKGGPKGKMGAGKGW